MFIYFKFFCVIGKSVIFIGIRPSVHPQKIIDPDLPRTCSLEVSPSKSVKRVELSQSNITFFIFPFDLTTLYCFCLNCEEHAKTFRLFAVRK